MEVKTVDLSVKTDDLSDTERKVVMHYESPAGIEQEAISREVTSYRCAVKLCMQKCADCSDHPL